MILPTAVAFVLATSIISGVQSQLVKRNIHAGNVTIDDTFGDPITGALPAVYAPAGDWSSSCVSCDIAPAPAFALNGTWHYGVENDNNLSITLNFTGYALWVYAIIPDFHLDSTPTITNMTFQLDGQVVGKYEHVPIVGNTNTSAFLYNTTVYANNNLTWANHSLVITPMEGSVILFDSATYTAQLGLNIVSTSTVTWIDMPPISTSTSSTITSPTSSIPSPEIHHSTASNYIGLYIAVGLILLWTCLGIHFWRLARRAGFCRRRKEYRHTPTTDPDLEKPEHTSSSTAPLPTPAGEGGSVQGGATPAPAATALEIASLRKEVERLRSLQEKTSAGVEVEVPPPAY